MSRYASLTKPLTRVMALLLGALASGCGGSGGGGETGQIPVISGPAPAVSEVVPLANSIGVAVNTKVITAIFSKAMDPATLTVASFKLACPAGAAMTAEAVTYLAASNMAMLSLPAASNLPPNTVCTATVGTGAKDTAGIPLAADLAWRFTTGAIADTTAPNVSWTLNANGATGVPINTKVGATFSEAMDPATINATTFTLKKDATAVPGSVTYSGVTAIFTPASNLAANTIYTPTITTGAKDLHGNPLARNYVWGWTTGAVPDTTAPRVTGTLHANHATNVAINSKIGASFSEAMAPATITNSTFTLKETLTGNVVASAVSYSGVSAVLIPAGNLASNTNYTVTLKGGIGGVTDLSGNPLASDFILSWTTSQAIDASAPTITATTQANNATNVAINSILIATFSKGMDPLTVTTANFTLKEASSGAAVAVTVKYAGLNAVMEIVNDLFGPATETLRANTLYTATVTGGVRGVMDLAGNPMASDYGWSWTTGSIKDSVSPTVISTLPQANAAAVAIDSAVNATFNEAMDPLTLTTLSIELLNGETPVVGTVTYDLASSTATFTPLNALVPNTIYQVLISMPTDLAANLLASGLVPVPWSFTTTSTPIAP